MATTAVIVATRAAATVDISISAGSVGHFIAFALTDKDTINILGSDAAATGYELIRFLDPRGQPRSTTLTSEINTIQIVGPADIRISKEYTPNLVEVSQYS